MILKAVVNQIKQDYLHLLPFEPDLRAETMPQQGSLGAFERLVSK